MVSHLEIEDGNPVWLSHDIWVVPGDDPEGPAGVPFRGQSNFIWCRVHNKGTTILNNIRVEVYGADPSTTIIRSAATLVGFSFVDLNPSETKDVLVLTPWVPSPSQPAHVCLIAQAQHPSDPLPSPLPAEFEIAAFRQVAQRNVNVVSSSSMMHAFAIVIGAATRSKRTSTQLRVMVDPKGLEPSALRSLGLSHLQPAPVDALEAFFVEREGCEKQKGAAEVKVALTAGRTAAAHFQILVRNRFEGYATVHILEETDGKIRGGVTYVVADSKKGTPIVNATIDKLEAK